MPLWISKRKWQSQQLSNAPYQFKFCILTLHIVTMKKKINCNFWMRLEKKKIYRCSLNLNKLRCWISSILILNRRKIIKSLYSYKYFSPILCIDMDYQSILGISILRTFPRSGFLAVFLHIQFPKHFGIRGHLHLTNFTMKLNLWVHITTMQPKKIWFQKYFDDQLFTPLWIVQPSIC